jgi:hypothetical protein
MSDISSSHADAEALRDFLTALDDWRDFCNQNEGLTPGHLADSEMFPEEAQRAQRILTTLDTNGPAVLRAVIAHAEDYKLVRWWLDAQHSRTPFSISHDLKLYWRGVRGIADHALASAQVLPAPEPAEQVSPEQHMQRVAQVIGDDNTARILAIVQRSDLTGEQKMEAILREDKRFAGKNSTQWAEILDVSAAAVRGYGLWKTLQLAKKADL